MSKQKSYKIDKNKKSDKKILAGGYVSSLTGINQSERAELYTKERRGSGIFENKKRKSVLKPKHRNNKYQNDHYSNPVPFS